MFEGVAATMAILFTLSAAGPASAFTIDPIVFDFEGQPVDSSSDGSLVSLFMTNSGLGVTIVRSLGVGFDVLNPGAGGYPNAYPPEWGLQALSPGGDNILVNDFFIASFSIPVAFVSLEAGDFGGDFGDVIVIQAFSNADGTGPILPASINTDSVNWGGGNLGLIGPGDPPVVVSVGDPLAPRVINSVVFRGGTSGFPNSVYFDNLTVVVPEPSPALLLGLGLAGIAVVGRRRKHQPRVQSSPRLRERTPGQVPIA